jgi:hypothetical protein
MAKFAEPSVPSSKGLRIP